MWRWCNKISSEFVNVKNRSQNVGCGFLFLKWLFCLFCFIMMIKKEESFSLTHFCLVEQLKLSKILKEVQGWFRLVSVVYW